MTTENNDLNQNETKKQKIGCGTLVIIVVGLIVLFLYWYISGLASGFANS